MTAQPNITNADLADSIQGIYVILSDFITSTDNRFNKVDERFDKMDTRFDKMDQRFDRMDTSLLETNLRLTNIGLRVEHLEGEFEGTKNDVRELYLMQKPQSA
jgi:archaellum component FlaC